MKYGVYAVKDELVGFDRPLTFDNDAVAIRAFGTGLKDPNSYFFSNPADFSLWLIAVYDSDDGSLDPVPGGKKICDSMQFRKEGIGDV